MRPDARARRDDRLAQLKRARPRSAFVRWSVVALLSFFAAAWFLRDFDWSDLLSARRRENVARFLEDVRPEPLRERPWDWGVAWTWARALLVDRGLAACAATLAIAVVAVELAALVGVALAPLAARNVARADAFLPGPRPPSAWRRLAWGLLVTAIRVVFILMRAIPGVHLGLSSSSPSSVASAWPAILALAVHNAGILGRLGAEAIENTDERNLRALRGLGATRLQIATAGLFPAVLPRLLLYFFYRWETCVREATVLGMLPGIAALGTWIVDARVRLQYDTMVLFVIAGSTLVLVGDLVSALARRVVRRAS